MSEDSVRARVGWMPWLLVIAGLAVLALIAYAAFSGRTTGSGAAQLRISSQMSNILEVNPLMTLGTPAPHFTLTDQAGRRESLSTFAGKSVVLTFGDDKCTDLCTLLAEDILAADRDLGSRQSQVQFVSINANPFYPSVAATKSWTDAHGLRATSNWHFLTGDPTTLKALAQKYGVEVDLHAKTKTIDHGAEVFFISPTGNEEQIGDFGTESANTAEFAQAMAQLAVELLPAADRGTVTGSDGGMPATVRTAVGDTPPPIELPSLTTSTLQTLAADRGKYVVVNFWSPTCTICVRELPAIERVYQRDAASVDFVGVDVSDPGNAGVAFATRVGATYPMLADRQGQVAAQYELPGLPYTVVFDPQGKVAIRHPGALTAEQLDYVLNTLTEEAPSGS